MDVEVVIENAVKQRFDSDLVHSALVDGDLGSIKTFVHNLNLTPFYSLQREVVRRLVKMAETRQEDDAIAILRLALGIQHGEAVIAIKPLGNFKSEQAITLLRELIHDSNRYLREATTKALIKTKYQDDALYALSDNQANVRQMAVSRLERQGNTPALIDALSHESESVRRVAAWYMGQKIIREAVQSLIRLVEHENDSETLRAAIWSLGVLKDERAISCIEEKRQHANPQVAQAAQDALNNLSPVQQATMKGRCCDKDNCEIPSSHRIFVGCHQSSGI